MQELLVGGVWIIPHVDAVDCFRSTLDYSVRLLTSRSGVRTSPGSVSFKRWSERDCITKLDNIWKVSSSSKHPWSSGYAVRLRRRLRRWASPFCWIGSATNKVQGAPWPRVYTRSDSANHSVEFAETRDRAGDLQIFSLTLSQLSYRGHVFVGRAWHILADVYEGSADQ